MYCYSIASKTQTQVFPEERLATAMDKYSMWDAWEGVQKIQGSTWDFSTCHLWYLLFIQLILESRPPQLPMVMMSLTLPIFQWMMSVSVINLGTSWLSQLKMSMIHLYGDGIIVRHFLVCQWWHLTIWVSQVSYDINMNSIMYLYPFF